MVALHGAEVSALKEAPRCLGASELRDGSIFGAKSDYYDGHDGLREDVECQGFLVIWTRGVIM